MLYVVVVFSLVSVLIGLQFESRLSSSSNNNNNNHLHSFSTTISEDPKAPKIAAIIPTCDRHDAIVTDAIVSALSQTVPMLEVIVALDSNAKCRQENQITITKGNYNTHKAWDSRVKFLRVPACQDKSCATGQAGRSRQFAMDRADPRVTHFAFLDDDDIWMPEKTKLQLTAMQSWNVPANICASDAWNKPWAVWRCDSSSNNNKFVPFDPLKANDIVSSGMAAWNGHMYKSVIATKLGIPVDQPFPTRVSKEILEKHNLFVTSSVMLSRSVGLRFRENDGNRQEDYNLWKSALSHQDAVYINEPLVIYDSAKMWGCLTDKKESQRNETHPTTA